MGGSAPRVHNYKDYRDYLGDWFRAGKAANEKLSFRYVARHLGLRSPNHFQLVITKKRHLSKVTLGRMQRLLHLRPKERTYLDLLYDYAIEKTAARRNELESRIARLNSELLEVDLPHEQYAVLANSLAWYMKMGALRFTNRSLGEIIDLIRTSCPFSISESDIKAALDLLIKLKSAQFDGDRYIFQVENLKTEWDFDDQKIKQFHYGNLMLALQTIPWPIKDRFFSNVTIPCGDDLIELAKKEIRDLCLRLLERSNSQVSAVEDCKHVVSLQFAMFPYFSFEGRASLHRESK